MVHLKAVLVQIAGSGPTPSDCSRAAGLDPKILVQITPNNMSGNHEQLTGVLKLLLLGEMVREFWKP